MWTRAFSIGSILLTFAPLFCLFGSVSLSFGFQTPSLQQQQPWQSTTTGSSSRFASRLLGSAQDDDSNSNDNDKKIKEDWDANVDYDKEWNENSENTSGISKSNPDPNTAWDDIPSVPEKPVLGIDISLDPLSQEEAAELKQQAQDVINKKFDKGIQDIERMRSKMNRDMERSRKAMQVASELNAQTKSKELLSKIDKITDNFLTSTQESRRMTKLAAAASQAMEGTGQGLEMGTWGTIDGRTVIASSSASLLGSVDSNVAASGKAAADSTTQASSDSTAAGVAENRILVVADIQQDPVAKKLVPALMDKLEKDANIPNLAVDILSPTSTMPLGGNNAACVICFFTSLSQSSSLTNSLDRLLRKTLQANGQVGQPPTQLVGISTLGTERFDKFPYNMQNMMGGGKLEARRQMEEVVMNQVKRRITTPPLDYTIIKLLGDKLQSTSSSSSSSTLELQPGDSLDDATDVDTAVQTIIQAVAYQPYARNSTLSVSGSFVAETDDNDARQLAWDKAFLCLDGPEVWRDEDVGDVSMYDPLVEYLQGWGELLAETGKGLTTPITTELLGLSSSRLVAQQEGIELLFLPTKTGRNYVSKSDERQQEAESGGRSSNVNSSPKTKVFNRKTTKEGGIDVVVEITRDDPPQLRVRARRCNYGDDTVIKELSEETILKRLKDAMEVWEQEHLKR